MSVIDFKTHMTWSTYQNTSGALKRDAVKTSSSNKTLMNLPDDIKHAKKMCPTNHKTSYYYLL
jgi:hypothetical protein